MERAVLQIVFDNTDTDGVTVAKLWRTANFGFIVPRYLPRAQYPRYLYEKIKSAQFKYMKHKYMQLKTDWTKYLYGDVDVKFQCENDCNYTWRYAVNDPIQDEWWSGELKVKILDRDFTYGDWTSWMHWQEQLINRIPYLEAPYPRGPYTTTLNDLMYLGRHWDRISLGMTESEWEDAMRNEYEDDESGDEPMSPQA